MDLPLGRSWCELVHLQRLIFALSLATNLRANVERCRLRTCSGSSHIDLTDTRSLGEIRLPFANYPRRFRHGADRRERGRLHHHGTREPQAPRLANGPLLRILDQFEIDIVRQPENAADDFCGRKSHGVLNSRAI